MKRSSQVALLLMGVTGVGATGYAMTKPPPDCVPHGSPAATSRPPIPARAARAVPAAALMVVVVGLQFPLHLDADQHQQQQQRLAATGVLALQHVGDAIDLGPAHQPLVTQHQHVDQHKHIAQCPDDHHAQRLRLELKLVFVLGRFDAARRLRGARELA